MTPIIDPATIPQNVKDHTQTNYIYDGKGNVTGSEEVTVKAEQIYAIRNGSEWRLFRQARSQDVRKALSFDSDNPPASTKTIVCLCKIDPQSGEPKWATADFEIKSFQADALLALVADSIIKK